ncbi:gamma-glutamyl-gamma-aminobutyrate hydrolase family protein [Microbacterium xanthum]|uniref:gamma-glutamyl-gamma-aminobutyrate hydrolase family protein n=1 Tax=Microbacterium xanthum TaxID=3079794 RepID=UPI002AD47E5F|nr:MULTISPECIES: gamma-glutamyl-gamma-aminobutyrate hydrolase family protein [unclassified Microbacterium]MDZ8170928.1 gamma-glutamyl-gamma-aminobutyrate hydrolase family protein [Microbacterium sp. KSW-48]MDZ8201445.1 gamma-glutamyl-gamma-aminobutyrate hydrolase family protein [Microbacterium sp. SSW1-59]
MTRPLVGVTTWLRHVDTDLGPQRPVHSLGVEYADPVEAAGGVPVLLPPTAGVDELLDSLDGLVISGGQDVHPGRYGCAPESGRRYDPERDAFEIALVRGARERGLPLLGICRGLQVVNVAFGGTLVVDLPATADHAPVLAAADQARIRHDVDIVAGSALAAVYGTTRHRVNTIHHQAVDVVAEGFRVSARADDGVVEGLDGPDGWPFWAVQWHPEKLLDPAEAAAEAPLFAALVAAAHAHQMRTDPSNPIRETIP